MKFSILGLTPSALAPSSQARFIQFIPHLERAGWKVAHRPNRPDRPWSSARTAKLARALHYRLSRLAMQWNRARDLVDAQSFDVIFIHHDLGHDGLLLHDLIQPLMRRAVYDFDDAIFLGRHEPAARWLCAHAGWVTPGNAYLATYARKHCDRVTVIPTVIDSDRYKPRSYDGTSPARLRIGWSGSEQSLEATLVPRLPMLRELQATMDFELVVIANTRPQLPTDIRWSFIPWAPEQDLLLEQNLDIGIMPLQEDAFQRGNCGLKLLQYMAAGLPAVASPVGVNQEIVLPGETGLLARTDAQWHEALGRLLRDEPLRSALGQAARRRCEEHYSVRKWLPVYIGLLRHLAKQTISRTITQELRPHTARPSTTCTGSSDAAHPEPTAAPEAACQLKAKSS